MTANLKWWFCKIWVHDPKSYREWPPTCGRCGAQFVSHKGWQRRK